MSIDFSTLQGLTIPEGVVVDIKDEAGGVIWAVQSDSGEPVILQVEKITSDTYAGEKTYSSESFILLDIYPKTNGTVKVTYGGLTKTITDTSGAEEPNAQQVYFGTFNGVSDSVTTPASGELRIEGSFYAFGAGGFKKSSSDKSNSVVDSPITAVNDWGGITIIPNSAFRYSEKLNITEIPDGVTSIGASAFEMEVASNNADGITEMTTIVLPATLKSIGNYAFAMYVSVESSYYTYLSEITILATTPPTLGINAFGKKCYKPIRVPKGCGDVYKAATGWSDYASYIVEAS